MRRGLVNRYALAVCLCLSGCTCAASHQAVPRDGSVTHDGTTPEDSGSDPVPCHANCTVDLVAEGYDGVLPDGFHTYDFRILAAAPMPSGTAALLVEATDPVSEPQWALFTVDPREGVTHLHRQAWPGVDMRAIAGPGTTVSALLVPHDLAVDAIVLFTQSSTVGSTDVHVAHVRWSSEGTLVTGRVLGSVATYSTLGWTSATTFVSPGGGLLAGVADGATIRIARIEIDALGAASIVERFDVDTGVMTADGTASLSGAPITDDLWAFARGGRAPFDTRPASVFALDRDGAGWSDALVGLPEDPSPLLAPTSPPRVVRWLQNPMDLRDTSLFVAKMGADGLVSRARVPTRGLTLPLASSVDGVDGRGFAVWSVRAPDVFADTLVRLVLFGGDADCGTSEVVAVGRLPGAAAAPSVRGIYAGDDVLVFGLPLDEDGMRELVGFRVRCDLEAR